MEVQILSGAPNCNHFMIKQIRNGTCTFCLAYCYEQEAFEDIHVCVECCTIVKNMTVYFYRFHNHPSGHSFGTFSVDRILTDCCYIDPIIVRYIASFINNRFEIIFDCYLTVDEFKEHLLFQKLKV
jgi:hypothetical protein